MTGAHPPPCDEFKSRSSIMTEKKVIFFLEIVGKHLRKLLGSAFDLLRLKQDFILDAYVRTNGNLFSVLILAAVHTAITPASVAELPPLQQRSA